MGASLIILMGPQGSGKGTQADLLCKKHNMVHLSSGALLRASNDPQIRERIDSGQLARSEDIERLMGDALKSQPSDQGILIDAFPRMVGEARWLVGLLPTLGRQVDKVIYLMIPQEETMKRLLLRAEKEGRKDDTVESIKKRLAWNDTETMPVIDFWRGQGVLVEVDGLGTVEEISDRIDKVLNEA